jgi:integrase
VNRKQDPIKKITTATGETRYRFIVDVAKPVKINGRIKRDQRCFTFATKKAALAERARIISEREAGTLVRRDKVTVSEAVDGWLSGRRNLRPSSRRNYTDALALVTNSLGSLQLQGLTKSHLDDLVKELEANGRRVGNVQRPGLSPRSINLMLTLLSSVLEDAVQQGHLARNVAKMVERPRQTKQEMSTWTERQVQTFLEAVTDDRLNAAWQLSLYGLRRGEVLGLRWSDIDLPGKTLTIRLSRGEVTGAGVVEGEPKTERGKRTLPLDDSLVAALRALKALQSQERLIAGETYSAGCRDCGGQHLVVDELGKPYRPEWYSDQFRRIAGRVGLPVIRLHDARHTSATIMVLRGVPITVVSKWHGHATAAFTLAHYAHSQDDAMAAAGAMFSAAIRGR